LPRTDKKPVERKARPRSAPNDRRVELRRQQAALSRSHILDAAEEVFALHGYHDSTIREIANLAGFSPAAVYGFVDSKEQLVAAIMDRHGGVLLELHAAVVARTDNPRRQLEEIIDLEVDYHLAHPNFGRLFQHTIGLSFLAIESTMDDTSRVRLGEALELLEALFARGIAAGEFYPGDARTLATVFSSMMQGYLFRVLFQDSEQPSDRSQFHELMRRAFVRNRATGSGR
jgi:AcrR family transcriptional regulator